jgi:ATP-dependent protease ClpP protease subunit
MNLYPNRFKIIATSGSKVPLEITAVKKGATAFIVIKGSIYSWSTASSYDVSKVVKDFVKEGAVNADVYVSSGGGDCFEAQEILNIIADNFKAENVKIRVGAVAASSATRFLTEYYTVAKKNSKFMIHKPMGNPSGNEDQIESGLKVIKDMTLEYKKAYASKMNKTEDEVEQLWAKGDYWMTAQEAKDFGLIDEIEDEEEKIDATAHFQLVACGAPNIPKIENTKTNIKSMELSVLAAKLGLPASATEAQVNAKLDQVTASAATAEGLVQAAANQKKADKSAKVKALLDGAEQSKKITAEQRPQWELIAEGNLEAATTALGGLKSITAISEELTPGANAAQTAAQAAWTYADYLEKDQEAFEKLPEAKQTALVNAHYKEN